MTDATEKPVRWLEAPDKKGDVQRAAYAMIRQLFPEIPIEVAQGYATEYASVSYADDAYSSAVLQVHALRFQLLDFATRYATLLDRRVERARMEAMIRAIDGSGLQGVPAGGYPPEGTGS